MRVNISRTRTDASRSSRAPSGRVPGSEVLILSRLVTVRQSLLLLRLRGDCRQFRERASYDRPRNLLAPHRFSDPLRQYPQNTPTPRLFVASKNGPQLGRANIPERWQRPYTRDQADD